MKGYLRLIARVRLLTAEQEVNLGKRIEAGLYAEHLLAEEPGLDLHFRRELALLAEEGHRAKKHLTEANLRLVVSVAKRYTGRGLHFLDLIQEGNTELIEPKHGSCHIGRLVVTGEAVGERQGPALSVAGEVELGRTGRTYVYTRYWRLRLKPILHERRASHSHPICHDH
ncbi:sigma-70 factor domain-containing protein [Streptomyces caelestis]|uniref:Uncharacterized protein n=1 Tax=Streptomyces caelestis TaxID=36816 RepID=A0A7W9H504_9ACTN|nr:sigma-70 factor domain-containing protein [Streptomyces caelestis]MBB5795474.1 hypothetical protein [Streptomyces caelestis]